MVVIQALTFHGRKNFGLAAALSVLLIGSCSNRPTLPSYGVVPDFHLISQTGQPFDSRTLDGKIWVANFIFTNCAGPCPRMSSQLKHLGESLQTHKDLRLVSFTMDPARDTPAVLKAYARRYDADPGKWFFLTGTQSELHNLNRNVFKLGSVDGTLEHSTRFVLVDQKRRIRGFYDTSSAENVRRLVEDIKQLD